MMTFDTWWNVISESLVPLSDIESQKKYWRKGNTVYFPTISEIYCLLFDDCDLNGFIDKYCIGPSRLDEEKSKLLIKLRDLLEENSNKFEDDNIEEIVNMPEWLNVCNIAREIVREK